MAQPSSPSDTSANAAPRGPWARLRAIAWLKPFRNAGVLLMGRSAQGVFSLAYLALAARGLGAEAFGALVLIHGVVLTIGEVAKFQSWQSILRYGAPALETGDTARLQRVVKFSLLLDCLGAMLGLAIVLLAIGPAARLFGLPPELQDMARLYGLSIVFVMLNATPTGVLRLLDRFDLMAIHSAVAPALRLLGTIGLFAGGAGLTDYLVLWFAATILGRLVLIGFAARELRRRGLLRGASLSLAGVLRPEPGIWRFALGTNLNSSLHMAQNNLGLLAVGWLLGPAAAGLYRIAKQFSDLLVKPNNKLLVPAIYPELARLGAQGRQGERATMVWRTMLLAGSVSAAIFAVLILFGQSLIVLIVGVDFAAAYGTMLCLALAGVLGALTFPLEPLLISNGRVRDTVIARVAAMLTYVSLLFVLVEHVGLIGAGLAATAYALISAAFFLYFVRRGGHARRAG